MSGTKSATKKNKTPKRRQLTIVMGVVIRDHKVLMTQRFEEECPDAHLKWELPGGKIKFGEDPGFAIEREMFEETGIKVKAERLIPIVKTCVWNYTMGVEQHTILLGYYCRFISQEVQKIKDHHVKQFKWIKISDLHTIEILPGDIDFIKEVMQIASVEQDLRPE